MVGYSLWGHAVLEFAAQYPEIPSSIVMLDSCIFLPQVLLDGLMPLIEALEEPHYLAAYQQALSPMCLLTDRHSRQLISSLKVAQHVLVSAVPNHMTDYDATSALIGCQSTHRYISAAKPCTDLPRFQSLRPQLVIARTLLSGHFSQLEVPDQVNGMISQFIRAQ
jgi:hypothetical protein